MATSQYTELTVDSISPHIFKTYDIRGVVDVDLTPQFAYHLGRAFGSEVLLVGERCVALGRDGRLSSPALAEGLRAGLKDCGLSVVDIGEVPTPLVYFACTQIAKSGIQITGSHNPANYNGFKMVLAGNAMYGEAILLLKNRIVNSNLCPLESGEQSFTEIWSQYQEQVLGDVKLTRPLRVVVDCGNGVAGNFAGPLFKKMGCEVIEIFCQVDGNFPNHHPDPANLKNLQDLIKKVKEVEADLGLAFDGDGDRLGVVTRHGDNIYPDRQLMLFAREILSRRPGATIVFDVKCSRLVAQDITAHGGVPHMAATGHSLIKAKMRELDAEFGGEMSGHIFFRDRWLGFDDALYTGARLLEIVSRVSDPSALLNSLPTPFLTTPEINIPIAEGTGHGLVSKIRKNGVFTRPQKVIDIDGLRVEYDDGFGLVRASNTTSVLVLRFEADNAAALARIQQEFKEQILRQQPSIAIPW